MQDSLLRSLLKGVVWRVFSTALTVSIILVVFHDTVQVRDCSTLLTFGGLILVMKLCRCVEDSVVLLLQIEQALQIGGLEFVLKLGVYFLHERLWVQIGTSIS